MRAYHSTAMHAYHSTAARASLVAGGQEHSRGSGGVSAVAAGRPIERGEVYSIHHPVGEAPAQVTGQYPIRFTPRAWRAQSYYETEKLIDRATDLATDRITVYENTLYRYTAL